MLDTSDLPKSWLRAILQTPLTRPAGYQKHRGNAARLSANELVKERVREIQAIGAERAAVTVQSLIDEAEQARIKAMDTPEWRRCRRERDYSESEACRPVAGKDRPAQHRHGQHSVAGELGG